MPVESSVIPAGSRHFQTGLYFSLQEFLMITIIKNFKLLNVCANQNFLHLSTKVFMRLKFEIVCFCVFLFLGIGLTYFFYFQFLSTPGIIPVDYHRAHLLSTKPDEAKISTKLHQKIALLKSFSAKRGYNATRCFMIDMGIPSGRKRFFIYNFLKDSVEEAGLVTHGSGSISSTGKLNFSNVAGSNSTSLGKYKIGAAYQGRFGLAFKLHGLDKTNSKAFERFVVLHAHTCVPEKEVYPNFICPSLGCPTVSPAFLQELKTCIEKSNKPILMQIYQ